MRLVALGLPGPLGGTEEIYSSSPIMDTLDDLANPSQVAVLKRRSGVQIQHVTSFLEAGNRQRSGPLPFLSFGVVAVMMENSGRCDAKALN